MIPYHYSVVRCQDAALGGEQRNIGLLVISPTARKAWLRRGALQARAHLVGDEAAFVRSLLDALEDTARDLARDGDAAQVHDWMRSRARPTEDAVSLAAPALGIAADLDQEVGRLALAYLGKSGGGGRTAAEKLQHAALRELGLQTAFAPRTFSTAAATWKFANVAALPDGRPLVFNALQFAQKEPEGIIDAAWRNAGRAQEVAREHPATQWMTVALGPSGGVAGRAFSRALEVMSDHHLQVIPPTPEAIAAALGRYGFMTGRHAAEAK